MSVSVGHALSVPLRMTVRTAAFLFSSFVVIFSASAAYGLLKMLLAGLSRDADIGWAELSTHSGLIVIFLVLAGLGAYGAKKSFG